MDAHSSERVPVLLDQARTDELDEELTARAALVDTVRELALGNVIVARQQVMVALAGFHSGHPKRRRSISIAAEIALWSGRSAWARELVASTDPGEPGGRQPTTVLSYLERDSTGPMTVDISTVQDDPVSSVIAAILALDDHRTAELIPLLDAAAPGSMTAAVARSLSGWHGRASEVPSADVSDDAPWAFAVRVAAAAERASRRGDESATTSLSQEATRLSLLADFPFAAALAHWASATRLLQDGEPSAAAALLDAVRQPGASHHPVIAALATPDLLEALFRAGQSDRFSEVRAEVGALGAADSWAGIAYGRSLALADGDPDGALAAGISSAAATGRSLDEARGRLLRGELLRRDRRRIDAREELRRATELFRYGGADGWIRRATRELDATAQIVRQDAAPSPLTPRQRQIAQLVAEGASNQEIAARLGMSRKTVEHHLHNAYGVLGIRSRHQLAEVMLRGADEDGEPA